MIVLLIIRWVRVVWGVRDLGFAGHLASGLLFSLFLLASGLGFTLFLLASGLRFVLFLLVLGLRFFLFLLS